MRGPTVFSGYFGLPKATAEAFAPGGWFKCVVAEEWWSERGCGCGTVLACLPAWPLLPLLFYHACDAYSCPPPSFPPCHPTQDG